MGTNKFLIIRDVVLVVILLLASAVASRELSQFQNRFPSKSDFLFMYLYAYFSLIRRGIKANFQVILSANLSFIKIK